MSERVWCLSLFFVCVRACATSIKIHRFSMRFYRVSFQIHRVAARDGVGEMLLLPAFKTSEPCCNNVSDILYE